MLHRREFLARALATATAGTIPPAASIAALRVSDHLLLQTSGDAASWVAPPGSTIKPFVIAQLLRTNKLGEQETYLCRGTHRIAGRNFTCTHPEGLPPLDPARVIAYSCNGAVAHFAERFAPGELASALRGAGFRVGPANPDLQALGEEGVWVTPVELARAYAKLAASAQPAILQGLEGAVQYGTARAAAVAGLSVAGKTGSAMAANGLHAAWFAGFCPSRTPEFVIVVALQGHSGGSDAAPIAAGAFRKYLTSTGPQYRVRSDSRILVVGIEDYVAGVLAGESSIFEQPEALKAMATAARTFAAHERGRHAQEGFDFCDTTHCQRFQPVSVPARLRRAVQSTQGELLRFESNPAFTPYTRSCGGVTEAGAALWPALRVPYLPAQHDPFCAAPAWRGHVAPDEIERALRVAGLDCPSRLRSIVVANRTASGRAARLVLLGDRHVEVGASAFRFAIGRTVGWNLIRSDWFTVFGAFDFSGQGEGHGVGMCQRGAEAMAARGHSHREILAFYYPGTSTVNWVRLGGENVIVYGTDVSRDGGVLFAAEPLLRGLPWRPRSEVSIYVYPDIDTFRSETREPGWIAAHTQGARVDLQPVSVLNQRGVLRATLLHELLHVVVEQHAAPGLPLWFREGIVEHLSGESGGQARVSAEADIRQREERVKATAAYRQAAAQVRDLAARFGQPAVLSWVSKGLPEAVMNSSSKMLSTNSK